MTKTTEQTSSNKNTVAFMQGLTVRQKIYIGFCGLVLLIALNMGYTLFKLSEVENISKTAIEDYQPAANLFQQLAQEISSANSLLNTYLLTGQNDQREEFEVVTGNIDDRLTIAYNLELVKSGDIKTDALKQAKTLYLKYLDITQKLLSLHDSNANNSGLILAQETLNVAAQTFLNNCNILLTSDGIDLSEPKGLEAYSTLQDLRYNWVQMMSNFRLFLVSQGESFLPNFWSYNEQTGVLLKKLLNMDYEIGFGELEQLTENRKNYMSKLPSVIEIFKSGNWRADSALIKTELLPTYEALHKFFNNTALTLLEGASKSGNELTKAQQNISSLTIISFFIVCWIGILLSLRISGDIVPPITDLMIAARQISDGDLNAEVIVSTKDEIGMLGLSFNTMVNDLRAAKLKEDNFIGELSTINEELESRVEERTEELRRSESKIRAVLDNIGEGILVLDNNGHIQTINPAAEKIFRISKKEVAEINSEQFMKSGKGIKHSDNSHQPNEHIGIRPDGSTFPMEYVVSSMEIGDETMHVCIVRDITKRKETEETLANAQQSLVESAHKSGMADMATGVLHNIGNILNSVNLAGEEIYRVSTGSKISGFIKANQMLDDHKENIGEFLTNDDKGKKLPAYFVKMGKVLSGEMSNIQKEAEELIIKTTMMKEVISTQQAYAQTGFHTEQLEIHELMEDALKIQIASLDKWGVKLHKHYRETPPCIGQKSKLLQVITNLIKNAKEAMNNNDEFNKPKELTIETGVMDNNFAYIKIVDNGCGISSAQLTKIFNHGFTTKENGHGFGLHTSANAMTEMKGSLKVDSLGVEKGASFTITVPLYKKAA